MMKIMAQRKKRRINIPSSLRIPGPLKNTVANSPRKGKKKNPPLGRRSRKLQVGGKKKCSLSTGIEKVRSRIPDSLTRKKRGKVKFGKFPPTPSSPGEEGKKRGK